MNKKYTFTYRRIGGNCSHCSQQKNSILSSKKQIECERDWKSVEVIGHGPEVTEANVEEIINGVSSIKTVRSNNATRMVLYFEDGGLTVLANWNECELKLGQDWVLATKEKMEAEAGRDIKLSIGK